MRKNRLIIFVLSILVCVPTYSQKQEGYVKTLGRPNAKGVALGDVTIKIKGEHNPVKSNDDGVFSIQFHNKKNGDAYALQEVRKVGYELNEPEIVGRQFAVSDKVRNTIVMVSTAQLQADKHRIENNAYKVAEKNYKQKLALLEKEKEDGTITIEKYQEQLQELQNRFEKYQSLIDGLAEHYAHTDYDELNEKEQEINICIENGDLERADSLILLLFDPIDVLKRNKEAIARLNQQVAEAEDIISQANADMVAVLKQQEKDAEHLYQLYTIALSRFDNEKAGFYIETRAELDTTNVEWQMNTGYFLKQYKADYLKALSYYERCLRHIQCQDSLRLADAYLSFALVYSGMGKYDLSEKYDLQAISIYEALKDEMNVATCLNNLGTTMEHQANYEKAREYFEKAVDYFSKRGISSGFISSMSNLHALYHSLGKYNLALKGQQDLLPIIEEEYGSVSSEMAYGYNNLGMTCHSMGKYDQALECYNKSLQIDQTIYGERHPTVANGFFNIGHTYYKQGLFKKSEKCILQALDIRKAIYGEKHESIASAYSALGVLNQKWGRYDESLKCLNKALDISKEVLGEKHKGLVFIYCNMVSLYAETSDAQQALCCLQEAEKIARQYGDASEELIQVYNGMGLVFSKYQGAYEKALEYYLKARDVCVAILGESHPSLPTCYGNIASVYIEMGNDSLALQYMEKALKLSQELLGENHLDNAYHYNNIAKIYSKRKEENLALDYYQKALKIFLEVFTENNVEVATVYGNIGQIYLEQGKNDMSLKYLQKSLVISQDVLGEQSTQVAASYNSIACVYSNQGEDEKAMECLERALAINRQLLGKDHPHIASTCNSIGWLYQKAGNYKKAIDYYQEAFDIYCNRSESVQDVMLIAYGMAQSYDSLKIINKAAIYYQKALKAATVYYGKDHDVSTSMLLTTYLFLTDALKKYPDDECLKESFQEFLSENVVVIDIMDGDTPASRQQMHGQYVVLEYEDWNQDLYYSVFEKNEILRGKPKDILVMQNGIISKYHFESLIGARFGLKWVGMEEKQRIDKAYHEWKDNMSQ